MSVRKAAFIAVASVISGCSAMLPRAPAQTYYDLRYDATSVACGGAFAAPVEVWNFTAAGPYDRTDMVVSDGRRLSFSRSHEWVARPGVLVAESLRHDLNAAHLFPLAVSPRDARAGALELTGNLYRFVWEREGGSAQAHLEADVVLRTADDPPRLLLRNRYDFFSEPVAATDDSAQFARAMSGAVAKLSIVVRRDLCAAAEGRTSAGAAHHADARGEGRAHDAGVTR
jgi:ABC-type uncharacterized transport system auxiliary subunit